MVATWRMLSLCSASYVRMKAGSAKRLEEMKKSEVDARKKRKGKRKRMRMSVEGRE